MPNPDSHLLSIAPMMEWTDRHCRFFLRRICRHCLLYTEMVTTGAILFGHDRERFLDFDASEQPLAIQLGGDDPAQLAQCARIAEDWNYAEVNLNVGCPSDRVQSGRFGACLMRTPAQVADMVAAMRGATRLPVTVKHRIGVDELDRYEDVARFVETVAAAGCATFIVHARKAWLSGLSPAENRTVPPLRYELVHRLKRDFPHLRIELNGGVTTLAQVEAQLRQVDGVMVGRAAYHDPWMLAQADARVFGRPPAVPLTRRQVIRDMQAYAEDVLAGGRATLHQITRHMLGLFHGESGTRAWKRFLSTELHRGRPGPELLDRAMAQLSDDVLDRPARDTPEATAIFRAGA
ncbi:MAG: tRNA dihydrouridine(20/20a) synthase DusA [Pseudomonadota bacterium]